MIHNVSFRRKVSYLGVIALLLFPLYMIGRPATGDPNTDSEAKPGGTLSQLRAKYDLSQVELGEIDPASESMKLATLGMRGVAANILWTKANHYKKTENWEALVATVNQMAKLQPNFITVWEFQSHNLSYNVSVEQDDYRFRYLWVKKGIDFLIQGTRYNRKEPKMFWTVGWYMGQKFGRADEHKQFRRLFRDDDEFHLLLNGYVDVDGEGRGAGGRPDTWLTSRLWYQLAYNLVDAQGAPLRGKSPHIFFADGPKARMNYASTIESEGYLDEQAEYAWKKGAEEWNDYGNRLVPTSWGVNIRLNDEEKLRADADRIRQELDGLAPGVRDAIRKEKLAKLTDEQRQAFEKRLADITSQRDYELYMQGQSATQITDRDVAERAPQNHRAKAFRLADRVREALQNADYINRYRSNVNFTYWRSRCAVEQQPDAVAARRHVFQAKQLQNQGELDAAEKQYDQAWNLWAKIIQSNPSLVEELMADDLYDDVKKYIELLGQLEKRLRPDFCLMPLLKMYGEIPDYLQPAKEPVKSAQEAAKSATEPSSADREAIPSRTDSKPSAAAAPPSASPVSPPAKPSATESPGK